MRAFKITNGDLVIGRSGYGETTGQAKIVQDLTIAVLTPYGFDRFHPGYGSVLESKIGQPETTLTISNIQAEVQRVISNYIVSQQAVLQAYQARGYRSPYSNSDLVAGVQAINVTTQTDTAVINAEIRTLAGQTASVTTQVTA
jgi:hypothetical protein